MADELPLILLTRLELPELKRLLSEFLEASEEAFLFREHANGRSEVNFCGVRFLCQLDAANGIYHDAKQILLNCDLSESVTGLSIGPADLVKSDLPILPLVRALLELGAALSVSIPTLACFWLPAKIASGPEFFRDSVDDFAAGGAFPSLALVRFESDEGGFVRTNGLSWFSNQEAEIDIAGFGENGAVRRLVRIIYDSVENGAIAESIELDGLEPDEKLHLSVDGKENLVRMRKISTLNL